MGHGGEHRSRGLCPQLQADDPKELWICGPIENANSATSSCFGVSLGATGQVETPQQGHLHLGGNRCSGPVNCLGLVHNPGDAWKTGNRLLGKLFLVIAGQAASQVEYAPLIAIACETSNAGAGSAPKSPPGCFGEFGKESTFRRGRGNHWLHTDSL